MSSFVCLLLILFQNASSQLIFCFFEVSSDCNLSFVSFFMWDTPAPRTKQDKETILIGINAWKKGFTPKFARLVLSHFNNNYNIVHHELINGLSAHMIHINLNMIFYTHVEHSPTKTIYIKYYTHTHTHKNNNTTNMYTHTHLLSHTHTHTHTHTMTVAETGYWY